MERLARELQPMLAQMRNQLELQKPPDFLWLLPGYLSLEPEALTPQNMRDFNVLHFDLLSRYNKMNDFLWASCIGGAGGSSLSWRFYTSH